MSTTITLPAPVDSIVAAINQGDTDAYLAFFLDKVGLVNDWGSRYVGHAAIRTWSDREFIGANCKLKVTSVTTHGNDVSVMADVVSKGFNGPSRFVFVVDGDKLREMRITAD